MDQGDPHYRLAITAFDDPHSLWGTIRALLAKGFAIEQFCLLASRTIMEQVGVLGGAISGNSPHLRMLTEHVEDWPTTGDRRAHDGHHIVATAGPLITSVLPVLGDGSADKAYWKLL